MLGMDRVWNGKTSPLTMRETCDEIHEMKMRDLLRFYSNLEEEIGVSDASSASAETSLFTCGAVPH